MDRLKPNSNTPTPLSNVFDVCPLPAKIVAYHSLCSKNKKFLKSFTPVTGRMTCHICLNTLAGCQFGAYRVSRPKAAYLFWRLSCCRSGWGVSLLRRRAGRPPLPLFKETQQASVFYLDNGMEVVLIENHASPMIAASGRRKDRQLQRRRRRQRLQPTSLNTCSSTAQRCAHRNSFTTKWISTRRLQ